MQKLQKPGSGNHRQIGDCKKRSRPHPKWHLLPDWISGRLIFNK